MVSIPASSSRSWKYDVFLSFRGEDTRKTFVDHLYSALVDRVVCTYKDDERLPRGDTIGPSLTSAIEESQIAIVIFSENYVNSSWCLDELAYIMKCKEDRGLIVLPVFYHVEPTDVRRQQRKYEEAFAKHEFDKNNNNKVESWRTALVGAGNIAGWEINHHDYRYEAKCIEGIVGTVLDKLLYFNSIFDENVVGMGARLQDLKSKLVIGSGGVRMVGIWGIGGSGKTTLASSLYNENCREFDACCFLGNIKDESSKPEGMETLQGKILSKVLKTKVKVESVDIGKHMIRSRLGRKNVLLVLDDIDDRKQLEALAGSNDWFGDGSRIIITTRNEQLLRTHRVNEIYLVSLLSDEEATRLFYKRAYNENKHVEDYNTLSQRVISYAAGLPLALIVLGSFLYDKDKDEWISALDRLKVIPEMEIVEKLKISYDGLKPLEKELFLDIVCFFRGMEKDEAMAMLEACDFHPGIGVKVLIQKSLITINSDGKFDMHDLVQEMGQYIVRGEHPNNPEKHSRLWRYEDIEYMCSDSATQKNDITEAIVCRYVPSNFHKLVSNVNKLRLLSMYNYNDTHIELPDFLSNELRYIFWQMGYPIRMMNPVSTSASMFPDSFLPRKLVVIKLGNCLQKELWRGYKSLPCLKELNLYRAPSLIRTPDFGGLPCLKKLELMGCFELKEIHPSLGNHLSIVCVKVKLCEKLRKFPTIVQMGKLEILEISECWELHTFPDIEANMDILVNLSLKGVGIETLPSSVGKYCTNLDSLELDCEKLKSIECNFHALKHLHKCIIQNSEKYPLNLPKDLFNENIHLKEFHLCHTRPSFIPYLPRFLSRLNLSNCGLKDAPCDIGELSNLQELNLSCNGFSRFNFSLLRLTRLKVLNLVFCERLIELPELPTSIVALKADYCKSLKVVGDIYGNCKWLCHVSFVGQSAICGERLLQSMLRGNALENGCMSLYFEGIEIPKGSITPQLLKGSRYRLQLPDNWYNHFSGFLICAAMTRTLFFKLSALISMKHETDGSTTSMDCQHWEETEHKEETFVVYVSFGYLKHTLWWDPSSTAVEFSIAYSCHGLGVSLVSKRSQNETTTDSSDESSHDYTHRLSFEHDSKSELVVRFKNVHV